MDEAILSEEGVTKATESEIAPALTVRSAVRRQGYTTVTYIKYMQGLRSFTCRFPTCWISLSEAL